MYPRFRAFVVDTEAAKTRCVYAQSDVKIGMLYWDKLVTAHFSSRRGHFIVWSFN